MVYLENTQRGIIASLKKDSHFSIWGSCSLPKPLYFKVDNGLYLVWEPLFRALTTLILEMEDLRREPGSTR